MFGFLFGWRNASKCKKLVKQVQCRLKLLKNKRYTIVRQLREDVVELIKIGDEERALNRAEQLCKDENVMAVYELLDHFCEFIIIHISYIRRHREFPDDINEAVSSLVFASARCGELPELRPIREHFSERYGQRFVVTAVELLPGNLVNREIKEKLSVVSVPDDVKYRLVDEIAREYCLGSEILELQYSPEFHKEVKESSNREQAPGTDIEESCINTEQSKGRDSKGNETRMKASDAKIIGYSVSSSTVPRYSSDGLEPAEHKAEENQGNASRINLYNEAEVYEFTVAHLAIKESQETERVNYLTCAGSKPERINQASSPETVVYLDDIEEFESSEAKDQRLFKFKSSVQPMREDSGYKFDESLSEKSGSRTSRVISRKRSRRRSSVSWENLMMNDVECVIYYNKPYKNSPNHKHKSHHQRKHQKKSHTKQSHGPVKSCNIVYNVFTYPDDQYWPNHASNGIEEETKGSDSQGSCASSSNNYNNQRSKVMAMAMPPYLRAKTMPTQGRDREICKEGSVRSKSCSFRNPNHVHPKLPEYDEIAAKFMALRKEHMQNKDHRRN